MKRRVSRRRQPRDIEHNYPPHQFAKKLRRLADCIDQQRQFRIQLAGERITIPSGAIINIEHERGKTSEEIEFQLKWKRTIS